MMKRILMAMAVLLASITASAQVTARHFHTWLPVSTTGPTTYLDLRAGMVLRQTIDVTLGSGTATCSGTATIATVLGGAQTVAARLTNFRAVPQP